MTPASEIVVVLSHAVNDEVYGPRGELRGRAVGGAGAYAAVGASLVGEPWSTCIVSGVGSADLDAMRSWFRAREVDPAGLFVNGEHSPVTRVRYRSDGERVEEAAFGLAHFASHTPLPRHLPYPLDRVGGVYLFHDVEESYWVDYSELRTGLAGPVLWEIAADACVPENLERVRELAGEVDILSLNTTEARALVGSDSPSDVRSALGRPGLLVALRRGGDGSVLLTDRDTWHVGVAIGHVTDPTGGGNSYSGALLAAYARTGDAVVSGKLAAAAAGIVIAQSGGPQIDMDVRRAVQRSASAVAATR